VDLLGEGVASSSGAFGCFHFLPDCPFGHCFLAGDFYTLSLLLGAYSLNLGLHPSPPVIILIIVPIGFMFMVHRIIMQVSIYLILIISIITTIFLYLWVSTT